MTKNLCDLCPTPGICCHEDAHAHKAAEILRDHDQLMDALTDALQDESVFGIGWFINAINPNGRMILETYIGHGEHEYKTIRVTDLDAFIARPSKNLVVEE